MNKHQLTELLNTAAPDILLSESKERLEEIFGKDFAEMKDYLQNNPHHCYDLLAHTLHTFFSLDCSSLTARQVEELKIAALYHDVGKPKVAFEKNGRTVFYGHGAVSERISRKTLSDAGFNGDELDRICFYIKHHDEFISFKLPSEIKNGTNPNLTPITKETVTKRINKIIEDYRGNGGYVPGYEEFEILMRLTRADSAAQSPAAIQNGVIIDTVKNKTARADAVAEIIKLLKEEESLNENNNR